MRLSKDEKRIYEAATVSHLLKKKKKIFTPQDKRRDHCHVKGKFRGAVHNSRNLNFKLSKNIPIIFHNLCNYDAHHIIMELGKFKDYKIDVIPITLEKYISFKI